MRLFFWRSHSLWEIAPESLAFFKSISCWPIDTSTVGATTSVLLPQATRPSVSAAPEMAMKACL